MSSPMLPRERCDFSAIVDRPPLKLPDGARVVVWTIVNYEVWDIRKPMARQVLAPPTGEVLIPDVPNWSWHEYGMRVGAWRFFELYERLGIRPTLAVNARTCEDYVRVAEEAKRLGWEFMGHAYDQMPIHKVEDQAAMINKSMDILERFSGKRPVGWLGPGLTQTLETPELLAAAGELIRVAARLVGDKDAVFDEADSKRASSLLKKLRVKVKIPALQSDLDAVGARIEQLSGRRTQQVIESLMRQKPAKRGKTVAAKKKRTPARKRARQRR